MEERVLIRAGSSGQPPSPPSGMADIWGCIGNEIGAIDYRRACRCNSSAGRVILLKTLTLAIDPRSATSIASLLKFLLRNTFLCLAHPGHGMVDYVLLYLQKGGYSGNFSMCSAGFTSIRRSHRARKSQTQVDMSSSVLPFPFSTLSRNGRGVRARVSCL